MRPSEVKRKGGVLPAAAAVFVAASIVRQQQRQQVVEEHSAAFGRANGVGADLDQPALARLAELRRRQGRLAEAEALLDRLDADPLRALGSRLALLGRAALALDLGDPTAAAELAERYLRAVPPQDRVERVDGLVLLARAVAVFQNRVRYRMRPNSYQRMVSELLQLVQGHAGSLQFQVVFQNVHLDIKLADGQGFESLHILQARISLLFGVARIIPPVVPFQYRINGNKYGNRHLVFFNGRQQIEKLAVAIVKTDKC